MNKNIRAKSAFWSENAKKKLLCENSWIKQQEKEFMKQWEKDWDEIERMIWCDKYKK